MKGSLNIKLKGGYAVEVMGRFFSSLVTDIVFETTKRQRDAMVDDHTELQDFSLLIDNLLYF